MDNDEHGMMDEQGQYAEEYADEGLEQNEEGYEDMDMEDLPVTQEDAWAVIR